MRLKTVLFVLFVLMVSIALTSCNSKMENTQIQKKKQEVYAPPLELDEKVFQVNAGESFDTDYVGVNRFGQRFEINSNYATAHKDLKAWVLFYEDKGNPKRIDLPRYGDWVQLTEDHYKKTKIGIWAHIVSYSKKKIKKNPNYDALDTFHYYKSRSSLNEERKLLRYGPAFKVFFRQFYEPEYPQTGER